MNLNELIAAKDLTDHKLALYTYDGFLIDAILQPTNSFGCFHPKKTDNPEEYTLNLQAVIVGDLEFRIKTYPDCMVPITPAGYVPPPFFQSMDPAAFYGYLINSAQEHVEHICAVDLSGLMENTEDCFNLKRCLDGDGRLYLDCYNVWVTTYKNLMKAGVCKPKGRKADYSTFLPEHLWYWHFHQTTHMPRSLHTAMATAYDKQLNKVKPNN